MNVTIDRQTDYIFASIDGSIDSTTVAKFHDELKDLGDGGSNVLIDLSRTDYINSDGLAEFLRLQNAAKEKSRQVVFISPSPLLRTVFQTTKLDSILRIVGNRDEAISVVTAN